MIKELSLPKLSINLEKVLTKFPQIVDQLYYMLLI